MFRKYIQTPFKVYAWLTGPATEHRAKFDVVLDTDDPEHAEKLNRLAQRIVTDAKDEDWIIFMDGDAFPIDPLYESLHPLLEKAPLAAIRRLENLGEKHPHPSFCATTVGFWKTINGEWSKGYQWINALNLAETDVGGELLRALTVHQVDWYPLQRTNVRDILPVCYGIYDNLIYHHGAGFRSHEVRGVLYRYGVFGVYRRWDARILNNIVPGKFRKRIRESWLHPEGRLKRKVMKELQKTDMQIREMLFADPPAFIHALRKGEINV